MPSVKGDDPRLGERVLSGVTVLLVDDHRDTLETIAALLRMAGAQVIALPTAQEAFETFQASPPDVLVCDIRLPGATGYNLVRRIRDARVANDVPAVAITGLPQSESRTQAVAAGFDEYVTKPIGDELVKIVLRLVRREGSGP